MSVNYKVWFYEINDNILLSEVLACFKILMKSVWLSNYSWIYKYWLIIKNLKDEAEMK